MRASSPGRLRGWGARAGTWAIALRRGRGLWIGAAAGVVVLTAGLLIGHFALPAGASTKSPKAGLVTAAVGYGVLTNTVTLRGQAGYADSLDVTVDTSSASGPAVVTGHVPAAGAELNPLSIALEVAGRPMIVLPGGTAAYRTLSYGLSGADVVQFKTALRSVGIDAGDPSDNVFDETAAHAVAELYARVGYSAPTGDDGADDAVRDATAAVQSAQNAVDSAQHDLTVASAGPKAVDVQAADNAVRSAQRALAAARAATPQDPDQIADLGDALTLAQAQRHALDAAPDTSAQRLAVSAANAALAQAQAALVSAQHKALPTLPLGEVLFVGQLPARVDKVTAKQGAAPTGPVMTLSGTTLGLSGTVDVGDAKLVKVGDTASFELADGSAHGAKVASIAPGTGSDPRATIALTPEPLSADQLSALAGQNVRVDIPVGATEGKVFTVPEAALTAGPGGESRVEIVDGDPRDGDAAPTHLVVVETGLAAQGQVEVRPKGGSLRKGELVVVAR